MKTSELQHPTSQVRVRPVMREAKFSDYENIAALQTNLRSQESTLTDLLAHAADLEHSGEPIPDEVNKRISEQRESVSQERNTLVRRRLDLGNAQTKFALQLQRYRALRAKYRGNDPQQQ